MTAEAGSPHQPFTPHEAARLYATHGYRVVPIAPGQKYPRLDAWQTAATSDLELIDAWWTGLYRDHGVGLLMGTFIPPLNESRNEIMAGQGHIFALDVDITDGKAGDETLRDLEDTYHELPETVEQITGSGGRHLLYRAPPGTEIRNDAGKRLGPGLDIRGVGGQIVAAPSIHPNGAPYVWVWDSAPWERQVADAPDWLIGLLTRDDPPARGSSLVTDDHHREGQIVPGVPGSRHDVTSSVNDRPGDRFNAQTTWAQLLENDGWTRARDGHDHEQRWTRPGKTTKDGISATVGYKGSDVLKVFTSSIPALEQDRTYDRFGYWAATRHHGSIHDAAKALGAAQRDDDIASIVGTWGLTDSGKSAYDISNESTPADQRSVELDALLAEPDDPYAWLVPGLIERGDRIILTGLEGRGKSTLLRQMAVAMASGLHPFTFDEIGCLEVLFVDCENSRRQTKRKIRDIRAAAGDHYNWQLRLEFRPEGIDLTKLDDVGWLAERVTTNHPDILIIGPIYKLGSGDPKDEQIARQVAFALDVIRTQHDLAILIEAHTPYSDGAQNKRPERPYGASLWSRWPEFGIFIDPDGHLRHWRGQRDEREWPTRLERSAPWPWGIKEGAEPAWDGPRNCIAAIVEVLDQYPLGLSQRSLGDMLTLAGHHFRGQTVRLAAEQAATEDLIVATNGSRNARIYRPRPTASHRVPDAVGETKDDRVPPRPDGGLRPPGRGTRSLGPEDADNSTDSTDRVRDAVAPWSPFD